MTRSHAPYRSGHPARTAAAAGILLAITVALGGYLGLRTQDQFTEIEASWEAYAGSASPKGTLISDLRGFLGYGGIIHNFKNYVLRQDPAYLAATQTQLSGFRSTMARFRDLPLSDAEMASLDAIQTTISAYEDKLSVAQDAARDGLGPGQIDALVRVDDDLALAALETLERDWRRVQTETTGRIVAAVEEGQALIGIGYWSILGLVLAALTIAGLVALLVRDLRQAVTAVQDELAVRLGLQKSQARLATVVEQSPTTIVMTDTSARIEYVNAKFEKLTGYHRDEVTGKTPAFLQSGETADATYAGIRTALAAGDSWHGVFRNTRKDGSSYWAETTILPLKDPEGVVQNFVGIGEDITEARRARDQVVRAQKLEAVGQLAGGVAHDFNNILTTIVGASHLAAMDAPEGSDLANEIDQIGIAARRAQHLVRELLTFARREPSRPVPVALDDVVREVVLMLRASIPPLIEVQYTPPPEALAVLGDATHLHQIVMNLCRNSAEALGGKAGQITITIEAAAPPSAVDGPQDGWVSLRVADTGPGMSSETQAHLFEPFFTTKPLGKGSGLGLAVVLGLVEDMNGLITVDSAIGQGCTFELLLPAVSAVQVAKAKTDDALPRGNERILLVDDEAEVAGTFRRQLRRLGYRVEAFTAPLLALERFRQGPDSYDLVISDIVMPDLNGHELANMIRAQRPDIPVIFCSAYRPQEVVDAVQATEVLQKPVDPALFARQVRAALDCVSHKNP